MIFRVYCTFIVAAVLVGCASEPTKKILDVNTSGFLSDYSILRQGSEGEAALVYWDENANFSAYDKIIIDPVTIWLAKGSALNGVSPEERTQLANEFHAAVHHALSEDFQIVDQPGPGTMRVRVALTDAQKSNPTMDTISTYIPQARLISTIATLGSDTAAFVGEASAEGEVRDTQTGKLLAAGVDRRAGSKSLGDDTFDAWGDVRQAFEAWAKQFSANLRKRRGG